MNKFEIPVMPNLNGVECLVDINGQTFTIQEEDNFLTEVISLLGEFKENHSAIDAAKKCINIIDDTLGAGTVLNLAKNEAVTAKLLLYWIELITQAVMSKKSEIKRLADEYMELSNEYIKSINDYIGQKYE